MTKQIIAIGGGGFGSNPGVGIIEKYIIDQSDKKYPKVCFIPTATGDDERYKVSFYSTFSKLNCFSTHLDFFKRTPDLEDLIFSHDIFYIGGGNTKSMLAVWQDWGLSDLLKKAYNNGSIMSGVSAGAICWFQKGITDSWASELKIIDCLGFISGNCCPHYNEEPERKPSLKKFLNKGLLKDCYAIEGGCALHFKDGFPFKAISFDKLRNAYIVKLEKNYIREKSILRADIF